MTDRRHAIIFNAISRGLSDRDRFAALSDREHTARLVGQALDADQGKPEPEPLVITVRPDVDAFRYVVLSAVRAMTPRSAAIAFGGLDADQLKQIVDAASGLAIHASRHRKRLAEAEQDGAEVPEVPELRDLPPEVRRLVHRVDAMRDGWAEGDDGRRRELWRAVHEANDGVWGRLDLADAEQPEPARMLSRADLAAELRTVREALDAAGIVIASLRNQRDEQRQRAARANVQAGALLRRAETAERQAAEQKARAQRAEADAADWRTTAHGYEQALRAEQAEASLQVTRLTSERDEARKRVDALGDEARLLAGDLAQERRAAGTYREQRDDAREDAETAHRHLRARARDLATTDPDAFREWLRTEIHRDPKWWREILRREVRLGWLREDFRRAKILPD